LCKHARSEMMNTTNTILFHEAQEFKRPWLVVLLLIGILLPIGILISATLKEQLSSMELVLSLIAVTAFEIPICLFFFLTKFETIVMPEGFGYRWWPLQKKYRVMLKDEIKQIAVRKSPTMTYGYHWIIGYGWVNNIRGNMGFQVILKSGKKLFIGSQQVEQLKAALEKLLNNRIGEFRNEF